MNTIVFYAAAPPDRRATHVAPTLRVGSNCVAPPCGGPALSFLVLTILIVRTLEGMVLAAYWRLSPSVITDTSCRAAMRPPTIPSSGRKAL